MFDMTFKFNETFETAEEFADFSRDFETFLKSRKSRRRPNPAAETLAALKPVAREEAPAPSTNAATIAETFELPEPAPVSVMPSSPSAAPDGAVTPDASAETGAAAEPTRRKRRTKAEMEAARAAEAAKPEPLPAAGSFGGPAVAQAPLLETPTVAPANGSPTKDDLERAFAAVMMSPSDATEKNLSDLLSAHKLARLREAKPEQYAALIEGLAKIAAGTYGAASVAKSSDVW